MQEKMSDLYSHTEVKQAVPVKQPSQEKKLPVYSPIQHKKHQRYFRILLIVSTYGLIDIATRQIVYTTHNLSDTGILSFYIGTLFGLIAPVLSAILIITLNFISSFTILWIGLTIYEYSRLKKIEKAKA